MVKGTFNFNKIDNIINKIYNNVVYLLERYEDEQGYENKTDYEKAVEKYLSKACPDNDFTDSVSLDTNKWAFVFYVNSYTLKDGRKAIGKIVINYKGWNFYPERLIHLTSFN